MATRSRNRRSLLLSLLLALVLHPVGAALVLLLWPGESQQLDEGRSSLDDVHVVEVVAMHRPAASVRVEPERPEWAVRPERPETPQISGKPGKPGKPAQPEKPDAPGFPGAVAPAGPPLDLRMRPLDLSPSADLFASEAPAADPRGRTLKQPPGETGAARAARVKGRVDRWLKEDEGRRNVELGGAHPALLTVLRRIQRHFAPTEQMIPARLRDPKREHFSAYAAGARAYSKMGSALPLDHHDIGQTITPAKLLAGNDAINKEVISKGSQSLVTEICIRAGPSQRPAVEEQKSSGARAVDRHARKAVERALQLGQPMPADLPPCSACYRFGVTYGRTLPTPYSSCVFEGIFSGWKCIRQGGKHIGHKVRMVAFWLRKSPPSRLRHPPAL